MIRLIDRELAAAEALLAAASPGPLCRADTAAVKAAEGAVVALRDARRAARRHDDRAAVEAVLRQWYARAGSGPLWQAYLGGGTTAIQRLLDLPPSDVPVDAVGFDE